MSLAVVDAAAAAAAAAEPPGVGGEDAVGEQELVEIWVVGVRDYRLRILHQLLVDVKVSIVGVVYIVN